MTVREGIHRVTENDVIRSLLVIDSVAAGIIHASVVPEHLDEGWILGAFFVMVAAIQVLSAIPIVLTASGPTYTALALINGAMIVTWILSRTIGIPIGPHAWEPEPVGSLDLAATMLEVLVLIGSTVIRSASRPHRGKVARPTTNLQMTST